MKKKIILSLFLSIVLIILLFYFSTSKIEITKYYLENSVEITANLNNDGYLDEIRLDVLYSNPDNRTESFISAMFLETPYTLTINGAEFQYRTKKGDCIKSIAIADLNKDNSPEILVGVSYDALSPSYNRWLVYNSNGEFIMDIYDGDMVYNKIIGYLRVRYQLSETRLPMYESCYYKLR